MSAVAGAVWVGWVFAAVFAVVALLCLARLLDSRRDVSGGGCGTDRSSDASHGVMSLGMAAMFSPWGNPLPALYWQVIFGAVAGWFAVRLLRRRVGSSQQQPGPERGPEGGTDLHHVLGSVAMVYMLAALPAGHGMGMSGMDMSGVGSSGIALPALAWAFVGYFLVYSVRLGARLVEPVSAVATTSAGVALLGSGPRGVVTSPHLLGAGLVIRGLGMSYILVTML